MNRFILFGIAAFLFLKFPHFILAASLSTTNVPSTIDQMQDFGVDVSLSCSGCSDSYLRGVFYPSGTSYFGYTQDNSTNWSNAPGSSCITYFKVAQSDLQVGTWSGSLKVKLDVDSSYYNGPGEYLFKVGRYTSSCGSPTWSSEITVAVTGPTPTPTNTPIPTSIPTTASTSTPTKTPTPTQSPTSTPTPIVVAAIFSSPIPSSEEDFSVEVTLRVLGESSIDSPNKEVLVGSSSTKKGDFLPFLLISPGGIFISSCGILAFLEYKKGIKNRI